MPAALAVTIHAPGAIALQAASAVTAVPPVVTVAISNGTDVYGGPAVGRAHDCAIAELAENNSARMMNEIFMTASR